MLHHLDTIDWSRLTHAQGNAEELPQVLKLAARGDSMDRDGAYDELSRMLTRDGTIFDATSKAVPFLFELLAGAASSENRESLLTLLCDIARGRGEPQVFEETHRAIATGIEVVLPLLRDPHPAVRLRSALLTSTAPPRPSSIAALSSALERERAVDVRASFGLALASLGVLAPQAFDEDEDLPMDRFELFANRLVTRPALRERAWEVIEALTEGLFEESQLSLEADRAS